MGQYPGGVRYGSPYGANNHLLINVVPCLEIQESHLITQSLNLGDRTRLWRIKRPPSPCSIVMPQLSDLSCDDQTLIRVIKFLTFPLSKFCKTDSGRFASPQNYHPYHQCSWEDKTLQKSGNPISITLLYICCDWISGGWAVGIVQCALCIVHIVQCAPP